MNKHVVRITNALFRSSLQRGAPPVFPSKISKFEILPSEKWCLWGPGKAKFMDVLGNKFLCEPALAISYGQTQSSIPRVELVKFKGVMPTAHLSARYEFFKDEFDQTCSKFILDNAMGSMNVDYDVVKTDRLIDKELYNELLEKLKLKDLENRWAMGLSNGQMRRARLARTLLKEPDLALIDDPFLGLDPTATSIISQFIANYERCPIVIGLRYQDQIPEWCTHICCVDENGIVFQGARTSLEPQIQSIKDKYAQKTHSGNFTKYNIEDLISPHPLFKVPEHEVIKMPYTIELNGLDVSYRGVSILKNLHWKVAPGSKWHVRGDNGTGKSTLLSLLTADHPQSWNSRVIEDGVPRKTGSSNYFDINERIGMTSPELHAIFLKNAGEKLSVRESVATGFREGSSNNFIPYWHKLSKDQKEIAHMYLEYFGLQDVADSKKFNALSTSEQKLVLFVRSVVKMPQVLILDEAFSAMETEPMLKCHEFLNHWPGTVLIVSHVAEETPKCNHYLRLVAPGEYEVGEL